MKIPDNLKYTKDHEWLLVKGDTGTIGVTDHAQSELGDIVFIDIDPNLKEVVQGANFGTIEAVKAVSEIYAPVSGKVIEINKKLSGTPEIVNSDPYGEGWMIKVKISDLAQLNSLLDAAGYAKLIGH
jgi:glycine cleavage system H protein